MKRRSDRRALFVILGLVLATVAGVVFKEQVIPPTPLLLTEAGATPARGAAEHYTGTVTIDTPFQANGGSRIAGSRMKFEAGARTHWHSHPKGQLLVVTEGHGWVQDEGGMKRELNPGDAVWTAPGVRHWHGATPYGSFTHVAVAEPGLRGTDASWDDPVSDARYRAEPGTLLVD